MEQERCNKGHACAPIFDSMPTGSDWATFLETAESKIVPMELILDRNDDAEVDGEEEPVEEGNDGGNIEDTSE